MIPKIYTIYNINMHIHILKQISINEYEINEITQNCYQKRTQKRNELILAKLIQKSTKRTLEQLTHFNQFN